MSREDADPGPVETPPRPVKRGIGTGAVIGIVCAVLASVASLGLGAVLVGQVLVGAVSVREGDCAAITESDNTGSLFESIDCDRPQALYRAAVVVDGVCPQGDYVDLAQRSKTVCLMLNVRDGDCLADFERDAQARKVACGSGGSELVVRSTPEFAPRSCPDFYAYSRPAVTICLSPHDAPISI